MGRKYWNIYSPSQKRFMLGSSLNFEDTANEWLIKVKENLVRTNKGRIANGYPPIVDDYIVKETDKLYHMY